MDLTSPPPTAATSPSSLSRRRKSPNMSLDLSDLPGLTRPSPPSNTLLITNLQAPEIFTAANLDSIQRAIADHAPIHTFAPLKSFRRIIVSFYTTEAATEIRRSLDGEIVLGSRVRVYFGHATKIEDEDQQHLRAPKSQKMFFISPPPSPPMGWEMRDEAPPNREVHAEDLATALARLHARPGPNDAMLEDDRSAEGRSKAQRHTTRQRSGTGTIVYDPGENGHSPDLPAISVEDTSASPGDLSPMEGVENKFMRTARPPVELMEH